MLRLYIIDGREENETKQNYFLALILLSVCRSLSSLLIFAGIHQSMFVFLQTIDSTSFITIALPHLLRFFLRSVADLLWLVGASCRMGARTPKNRLGDPRFVFMGGRDLKDFVSIFAFSRFWGASRFSCWSRCCSKSVGLFLFLRLSKEGKRCRMSSVHCHVAKGRMHEVGGG